MRFRTDDERNGSFLLKSGIAAVSAVILVVGAYVAIRPKPDPQAGAVVGFTPPPAMPALRVVVLRGGSTGCRPTGGCNDANYAQVLAAKEGWIMTVLAQGGTGYVGGSQNTPPTNFASQLPAVYQAKPDLVIVEGSVADQYYPPAAIQQAAIGVLTDLKTHLPNAKVVVVGPAWAGTPPPNIVGVENAVNDATIGRAALAIDPIAQGWFNGPNASLMAADLQSPTDQGHARIAAMIAADLQPLHLQAVAA